jgi:hypothetical protein
MMSMTVDVCRRTWRRRKLWVMQPDDSTASAASAANRARMDIPPNVEPYYFFDEIVAATHEKRGGEARQIGRRPSADSR